MKKWRAGGLALGLVFGLVSASAMAGGHKSSGAPKDYYPGDERDYYVGNVDPGYQDFHVGSLLDAETTKDITGLIEEFAGRWTPEKWTSIPELWDRDTEPYVLLAHQRDWLVGWEQIDGYFSENQTLPTKTVPPLGQSGIRQIEAKHYEFRAEQDLEAILYAVDRITMHEIDPGMVLAVWYVDYQYKPKRLAPRAEHFKANAIFKKTDDGWKFVHYGEAAMSTIMYVERMFRSQVSNEFREQIKAQSSEKKGN